ncbi:hypothetical protein BYT27DRAFT_7114327 [Phlegmacium glaucopus]|nr:hypothetical protein BYT27DRAFT_7114327 [Phlegmacium glaucopus]
MPVCFCIAAGCSTAGGIHPVSREPLGRKVDGRTFLAHKNADRRAALCTALQNTEATVDSQLEEITAHLSASVLADEVSGPPQNPGGSLWSRLDSSEDYSPRDKSSTSERTQTQSSIPLPAAQNSHPTGSKRSREAAILACLTDIEVEVDSFRHEAQDHLIHLGRPPSSGPPTSFPHADLLQLSNDLKSQLETITFKTPAVLTLKDSIMRKLQNIDFKVTTAKKAWNQELSDIKAMKTPNYGLPHETGNISFH